MGEIQTTMINRHRSAPALILGASIVAMLVTAFPLRAQAPQTGPANQSAPGQSKTETKNEGNKEAAPEQTTPQNDRIFYTLPNYLTVENAAQVPPLSDGEKFKLVARGSFDPVEYPFIALKSLIGQGLNSEASFGQGFRGYWKRYAVNFTDNTIGNFMANAAVPSLLREDPRYYQLNSGDFLRRTGYALSRVFVTRTDAGDRDFNYSEVAGNAIAAAISNLYHPREDRTFRNSVTVCYTQIGWDAIGFELKEFWPDIHRHLRKKPAAVP